MPDHVTDSDEPTNPIVTFQVEMTRVEEVSIELPPGISMDDLSSKRLYRWPDSVIEAIEQAVAEQLLDFHGHQLARHITEISHGGGSATG